MKVSAAFSDIAGRRYHHMVAVRNNLDSIIWIKAAIGDEDLTSAVQAWDELDMETQMALWLAPRDGGVFTTKERAAMHSNEFNEARHE